ncbi:MAG TPA: carboxypeptidase-like regulatory domain-containing protein [Acidobacteriaceae bacterium]|nr:carboxypeptidase-like regulatory domain-containing protein [Acidobacteriaceae bacterium]
MAQQATATVNGVVKDPTGAAIPNAQVELTNVNTTVARTTSTNTDGVYTFLSVVPGVYTMRASAAGFSSVAQPAVTLQVSQTATFNFQLSVGSTSSSVTVNATAAALETSTSELGTVVTHNEVNNLPLNGRNFTQLLTITAGVANLNTDQSSGGGGGWNGRSVGSFSFPAVNGARNRSNMFILDGANDLNTLSGTYNYAPIVDAIQEFKTQGHNDLAEYGAAAGGIITVVTKSGTNQYHGTAWEFLRNEQMDARGYFEANRTPLRQNQYGVSAGGPLSIPKLYDGRKHHTFIFGAWEGYKFRSAQETGTLGPTAAMRAGDFSALSTPIYDPATTTYNAGTNTYSRQTFTQEYNEGPGNPSLCGGHVNCIPSSRISPISTLYQSLIPNSGPMVNGSNLFVSLRSAYNQNSGTLRVDQNFGNNDQVMFRYSQFDLQETAPSNTIGLGSTHVIGHNYIGHWTHTFSPTAFSDVYFGRNYGYTQIGTTHPGQDAAFLSQLKQLGVSSYWMTLNNTVYAPQYGMDGYVGLTGSQLQGSGLADDWLYGGSFTKILGRHTIKVGADIETNNFTSPIAYAGEYFGPKQTAGLGAEQGVGGDSWASMLLGVAREANYRNIHEVASGGWINGYYIQDQWKATSRLTVNLGFRNNMVYTPIYGSGNGGNYYTGEANPVTGQYILNALPPDCSASQGAPCIPTGTYTSSSTPAAGGLPPHAVVSSTTRMIKNSFFDWAPRLGLAYRIGNNMVFRGSYSRFYDAWATITQLSQNFGGNWPAVNTIDNTSLNLNSPTASTGDPLALGSGGTVTYPSNDFSSVSQWMVDPNFKTPVYDQWNLGIQQQLPGNAVLDVNYVGAVGRHGDWGPTMNTPQPGPGDVNSRRPFPYMLQQWFDQSVGNSRYNALQVTLNKRPTHGVSFLLAYTLSHSNADGCNLGGSCDSSNPYNKAGDYGTSDLNQTHVFSAAFTAQSPFDKSPNKLVANVAGGWALNGILQLTSGKPYTVTTGSDPENIGCCLQERLDVIGNPNSGSGIHTPAQWFNTSAFAQPAPYTYGTEKVNPYVSDRYSNLDLSLFRKFYIGLGEERYFEFRADSFNLFNHVVFNTPNTNIANPNFGSVTSQWNHPREMQVALKFYF